MPRAYTHPPTGARGPWLSEHDLSWWEGARCRGLGLVPFFGPGEKSNPTRVPEVCAACPVRFGCYFHGLRHERDGTWGGASQVQLRETRRTLGIKLPRL